VLWLAADSEPVRDNLRIAALRHGVASERLVFAPRLPPADYLARLQLADLCLDTLPFSGGAAAADALWAGVPMLTQAGRSYAARLGGSLLHAIGLPELVMRSARTYEDKAVRLAGKPQELARLRRRLAKTATRRRCSTRQRWCATSNSCICKWRAAPCTTKPPTKPSPTPACRWSAS
jgi:predicted O-linked N-acetylglucosamine transferase (SPINDLY family)